MARKKGSKDKSPRKPKSPRKINVDKVLERGTIGREKSLGRIPRATRKPRKVNVDKVLERGTNARARAIEKEQAKNEKKPRKPRKVNVDKVLESGTRGRERSMQRAEARRIREQNKIAKAKEKEAKKNLLTKEEYEQNKLAIRKLSERARKLNSDVAARMSYYRSKGMSIENINIVMDTIVDVGKLLSKSKPNYDDVKKMRKYASIAAYNDIKVNGMSYKDIRREEKKLTKQFKEAQKKAKELYPDNIKTDAYTGLVQTMVQELKDKPELAQSDEQTDFYDIGKKYDPKDERELYKQIKVKTLPYTPEMEAITGALEQKVEDEINKKAERKKKSLHNAYETNIKNRIRNIDVDTKRYLEAVMSGSSAWLVCGAYDLESDQIIDNWKMLYDYSRMAKNYGDDKILDNVLNMIEHGKDIGDFYRIIEYIDREVMAKA